MAKEMKVHGDLSVKDKNSTIENKLNDKGFMEDRWGNKIYKTDSPENKERLKAKAAKKKKKKSKKKTTAKKKTKKKRKKKK